jgi:hypothetical protein
MFTVLILSNRITARKDKLTRIPRAKASKPSEDPKKAALNIPGYYEDILNKEKRKKDYKWELHQSF